MITKGKRYSLFGYPGPKGDDGAGIAFYADSEVVTSGTLVFSNSNSISFGLDHGSVLTATIDFPAATGGTHSEYINTSVSSTFFLAGNSTLLQSSGAYLTTAQPVGDYLTTAAQSVCTSVFVKTGFTSDSIAGTNIKVTANTSGISMLVPNYLTVGGTGGGGGDWATSNIAGSGISVLTGAATNTIQYGSFITTYTQSTHDHSFAGLNTTGITGGSATINSSQLEVNIPQGSLYYSDGSGVSWGSTVDGISTTITASINALNTSQSSLFQHTSATSGITSNAVNTSQMGTFVYTSASSLFQHTSATSAVTSNALNASVTSNMLQKWSLAGAQTAGTTTLGSQSVIYISGGNMITLSGNASTIVVSMNPASLLNTSQSSLFQHTSATSAVTSNAVNTSVLASLQYTSANTKFVQEWAFAGNNTSGTTSSAQGSRLYLSGGNNITLSGNSNTIIVSAANAGGAQTGISGFGDSQTMFTSGSVTLSAYSNISLITSVNGVSQFIKFSVPDYVPLANSTQYATSVLSGTLMHTSYSSGFQTATLSNTFMNTSVSGSFQQTSATSAITSNAFNTSASSQFANKWSLAGAQTAGTTTQGISQSLYLSGGNMITLSGNASTIIFSVNTASLVGTGALASLVYTSASSLFQHTSATSAVTSNAFNTSASSQFDKGWSLAGAQTAGTTTQNISQSLYLSGGNMMTLSGNASTIIFSVNTASLLGTGAAASFLYTSASSNASTAALATSLSSNASTAAVHTSVSNSFFRSWELEGNNTAGTTGSLQSSILYLSGGNNITLSGNSNTIVFSIPNFYSTSSQLTATFIDTGYAGVNLQYTTANTRFVSKWSLAGAQTAGTTTRNFTDNVLYLSGGNNITLSGNIDTIVISAGAGGGGIAGIVGSNTTYTSGTIIWSGDNITVSSSVNGVSQYIKLSGPTAGGNMYFSDANGVSWGSSVSGISTSISASVSIPPARRMIEIIPGEYLTKIITVSATQVSKRVIFNPFWLDGNGLHASTVRIIMSWVTNTTPPSMTYGAGLYSRVNNTSYALYDSTTATINPAGSGNSAEYSGIRMWDITGMTKTLSEGPWALGLYFSGTASGAMNGILMGASAWPAAVGYVSGNGGTAGTNATNHFYQFQGFYSATTNGFPAGVGQSDISGGNSAAAFDFYAIIKEV